MIIACICGGICEVWLIPFIIGGFAVLWRKIKNWKCCCTCHKEHRKENKNEK